MVIKCNGISKSYRYFEKNEGFKASVKSLFYRKTLLREAVRDFSFEIEDGEFIGLMGPNGAEKSTLVKVLTGIIDKTSGELTVLEKSRLRRIMISSGRLPWLWGRKASFGGICPQATPCLCRRAFMELWTAITAEASAS